MNDFIPVKKVEPAFVPIRKVEGVGEIMTPETMQKRQMQRFAEKPEKITAPLGQFIGGIAGAIPGLMTGHPYVGNGIGGVIGRTIGNVIPMQARELQKRPIQTIAKVAKNPLALGLNVISPEDKERLGKEIGVSGISEAIAAPLGLGITKGVTILGRGMTKGLLGERVAERGFERGWKTLLNPELYKNRVPKEIAVKTNQFFGKLTNVTGKAVDTLMNTKYGNKWLDISEIKNNVVKLLPKSGNPVDLLEMYAPKAQKDLIIELTNDVLKMKGGMKTGNKTLGKATTLWNLRKKLDKTIFGKSWTPDAKKYLLSLRSLLNNPIKNMGDDITQAFGRYSWVKNTEEELADKFSAIIAPDKEIYARNLEAFTQNLLSSNKDETIRLLKDLDKLLDAPDRIIEQALDLSAAETLEKGVGLTPMQKTILGIFGGRKLFPRIGAKIQHPVTQGIKKGTGRTIPIIATELNKE